VAAYRISGARLIVRSQLPDQSRTGLIHPHHLDLLPFTAELEDHAIQRAIGIWRTQGAPKTTSISSTTPAIIVDRRPRPPDFTLITDWPIIAQPAMLPMKPVATMPGHAGADAIERR
jgi:hypothetical protein